MTAFDTMIEDLYADPNMATDAVYTPAGGADTPVRILQAAPEEMIGPFEVKAKASPIEVEIRIAQAPSLAEGDGLYIPVDAARPWLPSGSYRILAPRVDDTRLNWRMTLKRT